MKTRCIVAMGLIVLVAGAISRAYVIGYYPKLENLIDKVDAIVR